MWDLGEEKVRGVEGKVWVGWGYMSHGCMGVRGWDAWMDAWMGCVDRWMYG